MRALPVGDVQVDYSSGWPGWLAERKSAPDLQASLCDGRWAEQRSRLLECGRTVVYIIEGDLRGFKLSSNMMAAVVNLELGGSAHVYRTLDVEDSFAWLCLLVTKLEKPPQPGGRVPSGVKVPKLLSKIRREAGPRVVLSRMLRSIPGISERVADKLVSESGCLRAMQRALASPETFPRLQLDETGKCIGKTRVARLRNHLLGDPPVVDETQQRRAPAPPTQPTAQLQRH